jgi:hypothetical protein
MDITRPAASHGDYADPVRRLLTLGDTGHYDPAEWPDYPAAYGLGPEHIDDLIRLACDAALNQADSATAEVWAPMHAWRALGQLRAEAAVAPLLAHNSMFDHDDTASEEHPVVFGMIGPAALPQLAQFLGDRSVPTSPAVTAISGVKEIAERHPQSRAECVGILTQVLEPDAGTEPSTSGFAVSALLDLAAVEAIDVMRDAFRRNAVDISIAGDLEDVEIELGLREKRATPRPHYVTLPPGWPPLQDVMQTRQDLRASPQPAKVGRNDPCPCGSGKKYKKCCLH